jgi:hypothetical protein
MAKERLPIDQYESAGRYRVTKDSGCWIWQRAVNCYGYPCVHTGKGKSKLARRVVYAFYHKLGPGDRLITQCKNRLCVNPDHLRCLPVGIDLGMPRDRENLPYRVEEDTHCWTWLLSSNNQDHPMENRMFDSPRGPISKNISASRAQYFDATGDKLLGKYLISDCKNNLCVNPKHHHPSKKFIVS